METIVKYRFDKEMVSFVKKLDIKTSMFGYDKNDVYSKFKDLLIKARGVCEELVMEEHRAVEQMKAELIEAAEDPAKLDELLVKWKSEAALRETEEPGDEEDGAETSAEVSSEEDFVDEREIATEESVDSELPADEDAVAGAPIGESPFFDASIEDSADAAASNDEVAAGIDDGEEAESTDEMQEAYETLLAEHEALAVKLMEAESELDELQAQLGFYKEREEELNRTADILREARLEGEAIIQSAQMRAEQELFLYRAKRRDEEEAFEEVIKGMEARKENLAETCELYRSYIDEGRGLLNQLQEFVSRFESPAPSESDLPLLD